MRRGDSDVYIDGEHYDAMHQMEEDIPFYIEKIDEYGEPALELACGTGRITLPVAEEGLDITGLDISKKMLNRIKKKAENRGIDLDLIQADMTDFSLQKTFSTIILPVNTLQTLLTVEEIEDLFLNIKEHLAENGRFIFQIFNPDLDVLTRDPSEKYDVIEYEDPHEKGKIQVKEQTHYHEASQIMCITWYYYRDEKLIHEVDWNLRIIFPKEIDALLKYNGFELENKYGNFNEEEFSNSSKTQIVVARKKNK